MPHDVSPYCYHVFPQHLLPIITSSEVKVWAVMLFPLCKIGDHSKSVVDDGITSQQHGVWASS